MVINNQTKYTELLLGSQIFRISRTCDIVMLGFNRADGTEICLNISGDLRLLDSKNLLISYFDMHEPGENFMKPIEKFEYDEPGMTRFDDQVKKNFPKIDGQFVKDVVFKRKDMKFANNLRLHNIHLLQIKSFSGCLLLMIWRAILLLRILSHAYLRVLE